MLQSYNSIILWNQNMCVQFRNCCEAVTQHYLWSIYIAMWDDKTRQTNRQRQTNEQRWMIYNRQYIMNDEWWDDDNIDFRWDMMNNEKWWIMRNDKFWRWYNMMNAINDDDSNNFQ